MIVDAVLLIVSPAGLGIFAICCLFVAIFFHLFYGELHPDHRAVLFGPFVQKNFVALIAALVALLVAITGALSLPYFHA